MISVKMWSKVALHAATEQEDRVLTGTLDSNLKE